MVQLIPIATSFIRSPLHNGVGRHVCQLQRVTFKFQKSHGGSNSLREFIEKDIVDFVRKNPGVVVYLKPRVTGTASITTEYLNGQKDYVCVSKKSREEILKWVEYCRNRSGIPIVKFLKKQHTDTPSIQGVWTPFYHKPSWLNVAEFPDEGRAKIKTFFPTATEQLLELSKQFGTEEDPKVCKEQEVSENQKEHHASNS